MTEPWKLLNKNIAFSGVLSGSSLFDYAIHLDAMHLWAKNKEEEGKKNLSIECVVDVDVDIYTRRCRPRTDSNSNTFSQVRGPKTALAKSHLLCVEA